MKLFFCGYEHVYQIQCLMLNFFPFEKINISIISEKQIEKADVFKNKDNETVVLVNLNRQSEKSFKASVFVKFKGILYDKNMFITTINAFEYPKKNETDKAFATLLTYIFSKLTEIHLPWGIYTGVRPIKTVNKLINDGEKPADIKKLLMSEYKISEPKIDLAIKTAYSQRKILSKQKAGSFSLFIFIPFCPSRCDYCSFVSHSIENAKDLLEPYLKKLFEEIKLTAKIANELNLFLNTVYIGGGTPSILNEHQISELLSVINTQFKIKHSTEYTFEAGRADTITKEKLNILKNNGVSRISINPQSFNEDVLKAIGRNHSIKQVEDIYSLACDIGFDSINMDFIAGLPTDNIESFKKTIEKAVSFKKMPDNITVHVLTIKRSAALKQSDKEIINNFQDVKNMLDFSQKLLYSKGYTPYYLYRQKNTVGSFENVGYSLENKECKYNILIMDETETIFSCGAGGVTKIILPNPKANQNSIERIFNYKYPYEYIDNFGEILKRKNEIYNYF